MEGPEIRAEYVEVRCPDCSTITRSGVIESPTTWTTVTCSECGEDFYVTLEVETA
jgi:ribosomal protein S27E